MDIKIHSYSSAEYLAKQIAEKERFWTHSRKYALERLHKELGDMLVEIRDEKPLRARLDPEIANRRRW